MRLILLVLLVISLFLIDVKLGLVSFLIIILTYNKMNCVENYTNVNTADYAQLGMRSLHVKPATIKFNSIEGNSFCKPAVKVDNFYQSINQKLVGGPQPRTFIKPIITTPCYSMSQRKNSLVVPNRLNYKTNDDLYASGYIPEECGGTEVTYGWEQGAFNVGDVQGDYIEPGDADVREDYNRPEKMYNNRVIPKYAGSIDMQLGYNPQQLYRSGYPANLPQGNCKQNPTFAEYNDRLFTQTVQPGIYYKNEVIEPIVDNIGISYDQQFLPKVYEKVESGVRRTDRDPLSNPPPEEIIEEPNEPDIYNTYDPRFTGYGTSYRNYVDDVTGQPRFPYDDVNSIRMPNYITRNKLDTHDFGEVYGPMGSSGIGLNQIRDLANNAYTEDVMTHRTELMERLLRKRNSEMWQLREAPIHKGYGKSV